MLYTVSADALQRFRLMLDTPAHEGVERGRALLCMLAVAGLWSAGRGAVRHGQSSGASVAFPPPRRVPASPANAAIDSRSFSSTLEQEREVWPQPKRPPEAHRNVRIAP